MALSFPFPKVGNIRRHPGQGCTSCVHQTYCPALYWSERWGETGPAHRPMSNYSGISCSSWSNNPADKIVTPPTQDDINLNEYQDGQGIGSEATRNGISDAVTGEAINIG